MKILLIYILYIFMQHVITIRYTAPNKSPDSQFFLYGCCSLPNSFFVVVIESLFIFVFFFIFFFTFNFILIGFTMIRFFFFQVLVWLVCKKYCFFQLFVYFSVINIKCNRNYESSNEKIHFICMQ